MKNITNKNIRKTAATIGIVLLAAVFSAGVRTNAYSIEQLKNVAASGDYVVGPGKQEMTLKPGESKTVPLTVTNRTGETRTFEIGFEDVAGSADPMQTVTLLGAARGHYSLKDFMSVAERTFVLKQGEQAIVPVKVSVPNDAEAGGKYGSVVVSTVSDAPAGGNGTAIVSRIGTLFFVTVPGKILSEGKVSKFETVGKKTVYGSGPVDFDVLFENSGNVHLNPYGQIDIRDIFGGHVASLRLDPWFALPESVRSRVVTWNDTPAWGIYKATARINRGYGDIVDEKSLTIVVLPAKAVAGFIGIIVLLAAAGKMIRKRKK